MCSNKTVFLFFLLNLLHTNALPTQTQEHQFVQVSLGKTVTLKCPSIDENHSFFYWLFNEREVVIGPTNEYDNAKFRYEVLSGNLTIKSVSKHEEGVYNCVSRSVRDDGRKIRSVRLVVKTEKEIFEYNQTKYLLCVIIVLSCLLLVLLSVLGYFSYRIWKNECSNPVCQCIKQVNHSMIVPVNNEQESTESSSRLLVPHFVVLVKSKSDDNLENASVVVR